MAGKLEKLMIEAYTDPKFNGGPRSAFTVMFNPSSYTEKYAVEYDSEQGKGTTAIPQRYKRTRSTAFDLEFVLDGTGASVELSQEQKPLGVAGLVKAFLHTVQVFDGSIHRPPYLILKWGGLFVTCVFKSADIKYTLFDPGGMPLRATVTASFLRYVDDEKRDANESTQSTDLVHVHLVREGETLPFLAQRYYERPDLYLDVARFNELDDIRSLQEGQRLVFPPLAKR